MEGRLTIRRNATLTLRAGPGPDDLEVCAPGPDGLDPALSISAALPPDPPGIYLV